MFENCSKNVLLGNVARLFVGYPFRSTCIPGEQGILTCFLKDVDSSGVLNVAALKRVDGAMPNMSHIAREGQVVFRSRGASFVAALVPQLFEDLLVAAPMIRIEVDKNMLLPEYLVWYINSSYGAAYFKEFAKGTGIPLISKSVLEVMPMKLPDLESQKNIVDLMELNRRERNLLSEIASKKDLILETEITNYLESL